MTDSTSPKSSSSSNPDRAKRKKWLKWGLIGAGGLVVAGGMLVLLTPTLLSTSVGKGIVLGQVNKNLAGVVEVESWSLGWFSGIELSGVKVLDDQKRTAVTIGHVKTDLTVLRAATGNYDLGETTVSNVNLVLVELDKAADGSIATNLQRIAKSEPSAEKTPSSEPSKLPGLKGNITIKNLTGTLQGTAVGSKPIRIGDSNVAIKIPDLTNAPISNDVTLVVGRDGEGMGTVAVAGDVQAIFSGQVDVTKLTASEKLTLTGLNLAAVNAFLSGMELGGIANGGIEVKLAGINSVDAKGEIRLTNALFGGQVLSGDRYTSATLSLPLDVATSGDVIKVTRLGLVGDDVNVSVAGEVTRKALENLSALKAPGGTGKLTVDAAVPNLAAVAAKLPKTLKLQDGVTLTGGSAKAGLQLVIGSEDVTVSGETRVEGVQGTNQGKGISLSPVSLQYMAAAQLANGGVSALKIDRIALESSFATAGVRGTLEDLAFVANVSLDKFRQEVGQFADFGGIQLAGSVTSTGSVKKAAEYAWQTATDTSIFGLRVVMPAEGKPPTTLNVESLRVTSKAKVSGDQNKPFAVAEIEDVTVSAGAANRSIVSLNATGTVDLVKAEVPNFNLKNVTIPDVGDVQRRFGSLIPALTQQGLDLNQGAIYVSATGSYAGGKLTLPTAASVQVDKLTLSKDKRPVLQGQTLGVKMAGVVDLSSGTRVDLSELQVASSGDLVSVNKSSDRVRFEMKPDGAISGDGGVQFVADLGRLQTLATAWNNTPPAQQAVSGNISGKVDLVTKGSATSAKGSVDLAKVTVGRLLQNETVALTFDLASPDSFKSFTGQAAVKSAFANATVQDLRLTLEGATFDMLRGGNVTVTSSDLHKVDTLIKAMTPPAAVKPGDIPVPPLIIDKGAADIALAVSRQGNQTTLDISRLKVTGLEFTKGTGGFRMPRDVDLKVNVAVAGTDAVESLTVSALDGQVGVGTVKLTEPLALTNLSAAVPTAKGAIEIAGQLQTVTSMLEVIQGVPQGSKYPYIGEFVATQKFGNADGVSALQGALKINDFRLLDSRGAVKFAESRLEVANDLAINLNSMDIDIKRLSILSPETNALNVLTTGKIKDASNTCVFTEPLKLKLNYDLAKLLPLVQPLLSPTLQSALQNATAKGTFEREFVVSGAYPQNVDSNVAIRQLKVTGGLGIGEANIPVYGVTLSSSLEPSFKLDKGILILSSPKAATLNGGSCDLDNIQLDLTKPEPTLSMSAGKQLLTNVGLNSILAKQLANMAFIFANADDAKGRLNLVVYQCVNVPLSAVIAPPPVAQSGTRDPLGNFLTTPNTPPPTTNVAVEGLFDANLTVTEFGLTGGPLGKFVQDLPVVQKLASGSVDKGRVRILNGVATQDFDLRLSIGQIKAQGDILLASQQFQGFTFFVSPAAIEGLLGPLKGLGGLTDVPIKVTGTLSNPRWDIAGSVGTYIKNNIGRLGGIPGDLGRILPGGNNDGGSGSASPSTQPGNPLDRLFKGLGGDQDKKDNKKDKKK